MTDEWRLVPGSDGKYEVSRSGQIRRVNRRLLTPVKQKRGYTRVKIWADGRLRLWPVHQVVAMTFIGPRPTGYQVNHIDSNPSNNRVENLEYVTPLENQAHSWRTTDRKSPHRGTSTHFAKLSDTDVIKIRQMRTEGLSYSAIATHFNTKPANVWHICMGRTWKHLL